LRPRFLGDRDQTSLASEQGSRALEELATDGVEHEIDRAEPLVELPPAVDYLVRSERACGVERFGRRGRNDVGAAPARQLSRELADTADRSVDQHPLASLEAAVREQALPGTERGQRNGRALDMAERRRLRSERRRRDDGVLGGDTVAVEGRQREDLVAGGDRHDLVCDRRNHTRELVRRDRGQPVERPLELAARDRRRVHLDERLAEAERTSLDRLVAETVDAGRVEPDCPHCSRNCDHPNSLSSEILAGEILSATIQSLVMIGEPRDHVDEILAEWRRERPDLDVAPLGLYGRLFRVVNLSDDAFAKGLAPHGLQPGWFDLLAALRRAGAPYELNPTQLMGATLLSSSGMTKRLDRMEAAGLIERRPDLNDRRGTLVRLTRRGKSVIDRAVETHVVNEERLLSALTAAERRTLDGLLKGLLVELERGS
jgi:DNA-binding MarR family transcriptional regulator